MDLLRRLRERVAKWGVEQRHERPTKERAVGDGIVGQLIAEQAPVQIDGFLESARSPFAGDKVGKCSCRGDWQPLIRGKRSRRIDVLLQVGGETFRPRQRTL